MNIGINLHENHLQGSIYTNLKYIGFQEIFDRHRFQKICYILNLIWIWEKHKIWKDIKIYDWLDFYGL